MNKKIILAVLSVVIIIAAAAIGIFTQKDTASLTKNINLYFLNETGSSIIAEQREIKYNQNNELVDLVIANLLKGPSDNKKQPVAGKNTEVLNISYNESNLTVDFSKEFLREDVTCNMLSVYAVVRTLCQIDKITGVMVTVEGRPVKGADENYIGFLTNSDINLESDTYTTDSKDIILYFADKEGKNLVKEVRTIKINDTRPIESYIINELIKGPVNKELLPTLTSDTELISAETAKGTCHVTFKNFIDKNLSDPSSEKSRLAIYSVVNSLAELDSVHSVRFLFEGKTEEMVGAFDFSKEFKEDKSLIAK